MLSSRYPRNAKHARTQRRANPRMRSCKAQHRTLQHERYTKHSYANLLRLLAVFAVVFIFAFGTSALAGPVSEFDLSSNQLLLAFTGESVAAADESAGDEAVAGETVGEVVAADESEGEESAAGEAIVDETTDTGVDADASVDEVVSDDDGVATKGEPEDDEFAADDSELEEAEGEDDGIMLLAGSSTQTATSTCKVTLGSTVTYYDTLNEAISGATTGSTIEVFKATTNTGAATAGKNLTIKCTSSAAKVNFTSTGFIQVSSASNLTLEGVIFDGQNRSTTSYSCLMLMGTGTVTIKNSSTVATQISNFNTAGASTNIAGGFATVYSTSKLVMQGGTISNCSSVLYGGAIDVNSANASFTMSGGTITDCKSINGGAIRTNGAMTMSGGTISNCSTSASGGLGGAIYADNTATTLTMSGGTISGCKAVLGSGWTGGGSAVCLSGTMNMTGGIIKECGDYVSVPYAAGPIYMYNASAVLNMSGGQITNNKGSHGGAISLQYGKVNLTNTAQLTNNSVYYDGGAVYMAGGTTMVCGTYFPLIAGNSCGRSGSAIHIRNTANLTIQNQTIITGNHSTGSTTATSASVYSGAVCGLNSGGQGNITIKDNPIIMGNTAVVSGATVAANVGVATNTRSTLKFGSLGWLAQVGVYAEPGNEALAAAGAQFATGTTTASSLNYLRNITNDRNPVSSKYLNGVAGSSTAINWSAASATGSVCKVVETRNYTINGSTTSYQLPHLFTSITDAVTFIKNNLAQTNGTTTGVNRFPGSAKIEMLVASYTLPAQVTVDQGAIKEIVLTTASSSASDGYSYTGASGGRATVLRGYNNNFMFLASAANTTSGSKFTVENIIIDGNKSKYTSNVIADTLRANQYCTVTMNSGATVQNSKSTSSYGAVGSYGAGNFSTAAYLYLNPGSEVKNCEHAYGGGLYIDQGSIAVIDGASITGNVATNSGGGVATYMTRLTIKGDTVISGNKAAELSGVRMGGSTGKSTYIYLQGNTKITNNTCTGTDSSMHLAAVGRDKTANWDPLDPIYLQDSVYIYNNKNASGAQANAWDGTALNSGSTFYLSGALTSSAKIGIWAENSYVAESIFAHTVASYTSSAKTASDLSVFSNDRDTSLVAKASVTSDTSGIRWTKGVCKIVDNGETNIFSTIAAAVNYGKTLTSDVTIEMLIADHTEPTVVSMTKGSAKSLTLTTANPDATDGYPYQGSAGTPALIKPKAGLAGSFFTVPVASNVTFKDVTLDGYKGVNNSTTLRAISNAGTLTLDNTTVKDFVMWSPGSYTGTGAAVYSTGECTLKGNTLITGNIVYKSVTWTGGAVAAAGGTMIIQDNVVIEKNSGHDAGGLAILGAASVTLKDNASINNNEARNPGGGVYIYNTGGTLNMEGGSIHDNCAGAYGGGGVMIHSGGTMHMSAGKIYNNTVKGSWQGGGVAVYTSTSSLYVSGDAYIAENTSGGSINSSTFVTTAGTTKNNVFEATGVYIVVEGNLSDNAKIGITASGNDTSGIGRMKAGGQFGATADSDGNSVKATTVSGLGRFFCDTDDALVSVAGSDSKVIWAYENALTITKTLPEAVDRDTWFTVIVRESQTGRIVRQSIKVPKGSTSGSATIQVCTAYTYGIGDRTQQSNWRYENESIAYASNESTLGTVRGSGSGTVLGILTMSQENASYREVTLGTKLAHPNWEANGSSVINTLE